MTMTSLTEWMELLTSPERTYNDGTRSVDVYGEGDQSYIVLERELKSDSPKSSIQYVLHAPEDSNRLYSFLSLLNESDFDLDRLFNKIETATYKIEEMNEIALLSGFSIARYEFVENKKA